MRGWAEKAELPKMPVERPADRSRNRNRHHSEGRLNDPIQPLRAPYDSPVPDIVLVVPDRILLGPPARLKAPKPPITRFRSPEVKRPETALREPTDGFPKDEVVHAQMLVSEVRRAELEKHVVAIMEEDSRAKCSALVDGTNDL